MESVAPRDGFARGVASDDARGAAAREARMLAIATVAPCSGCGAPLELCQPIEDDPERLVGGCPDCRLIHAVRLDPESGAPPLVRMVAFPRRRCGPDGASASATTAAG